MGYATSETSSLIPLPLERARFLAKALQEERTANEAWFWCGPDAEVSVGVTGTTLTRVDIRVEHGAQSFEEVRASVAALVARHVGVVELHVNTLGPEEARGLGKALGASGRSAMPYGPLLPGAVSSIGLDMHRAEKAGLWLARAAARSLVMRGARAAFVAATYAPGDRVPFFVSARDEKGKDLSSEIDRSRLALDRVMREWFRPGLNVDAARWGFVGEPGLPWEAETG
jgi:S-adenosylmethionine synthetase